MKNDRVILGIDPGFVTAGFAVIEVASGRIILKEAGALRQPSSRTLAWRIVQFHDFFSEKFTTFRVTELALETPFLGKNAQNFLKLGYLRGMLLFLAERHGLVLHEFSPRQVKQAITGYGHADKAQVFRVIARLFPGFAKPESFDVSDAVAIALCATWRPTCSPSRVSAA
ncbi:MAG: crossover junction endodeoxyribonuclease RuvC [Candidatus Dependentiae bacterium]|nr:crossover junction endodeoxyribonuclease RuvC [Candidatus Dependentiae bacterium]